MRKAEENHVTAELEGKFQLRLKLPVHFWHRVMAPFRVLIERIYAMVTGNPLPGPPPDDSD